MVEINSKAHSLYLHCSMLIFIIYKLYLRILVQPRQLLNYFSWFQFPFSQSHLTWHYKNIKEKYFRTKLWCSSRETLDILHGCQLSVFQGVFSYFLNLFSTVVNRYVSGYQGHLGCAENLWTGATLWWECPAYRLVTSQRTLHFAGCSSGVKGQLLQWERPRQVQAETRNRTTWPNRKIT